MFVAPLLDYNLGNTGNVVKVAFPSRGLVAVLLINLSLIFLDDRLDILDTFYNQSIR